MSPRYAKPYVLIKQRTPKGKVVWYYRLAREKTKHSTGKARKPDAEAYVEDLISRPVGADIPLRAFASQALEEHFAARAARGRPVGMQYEAASRRYLKDYILEDPIAAVGISELRQGHIEDCQTRLMRKHPEQPRSVNLAMDVLRLVVRRAWRRGMIAGNPFEGLERAEEKRKERSLYTLKDLDKLFPADVWDKNDFSPWSGPYDYTAFILAASTGMRRGEILALGLDPAGGAAPGWEAVNFEDAMVRVEAAIEQKGQVKAPKAGRTRYTPIFDFLLWPDRRAVRALRELRALQQGGKIVRLPGAIFAYDDGSLRRGTWWTKHLVETLKNAKIKRDRDPGHKPLDAHSFRWTLASNLKGLISDDLIRLYCGWTSDRMQRNYTRLEVEQVKRIIGLAQAGR